MTGGIRDVEGVLIGLEMSSRQLGRTTALIHAANAVKKTDVSKRVVFVVHSQMMVGHIKNDYPIQNVEVISLDQLGVFRGANAVVFFDHNAMLEVVHRGVMELAKETKLRVDLQEQVLKLKKDVEDLESVLAEA